jgi:hypothetical protein
LNQWQKEQEKKKNNRKYGNRYSTIKWSYK